MNVIRVRRVGEFKGEDVVLLAVDGAGLDAFLAALTQASSKGPRDYDVTWAGRRELPGGCPVALAAG